MRARREIEGGDRSADDSDSDHGHADTTLAFEAAARYGLFVTGGSDYHGKYGAPASLGEAFVMPDEAGPRVEELFAREARLS